MSRGFIVAIVLVAVGAIAGAIWYFGSRIGAAASALEETNRNVDQIQSTAIGGFLFGR